MLKLYQIGHSLSIFKQIVVEGLINFDVYDEEYLVIYRSTNIIDVYIIIDYISFSYKMRLPLYQ